MLYFGFFMGVLYIGLGIIFLFFPVFMYLPINVKKIFGAFFLIYGIFRIVKLIQKVRES